METSGNTALWRVSSQATKGRNCSGVLSLCSWIGFSQLENGTGCVYACIRFAAPFRLGMVNSRPVDQLRPVIFFNMLDCVAKLKWKSDKQNKQQGSKIYTVNDPLHCLIIFFSHHDLSEYNFVIV